MCLENIISLAALEFVEDAIRSGNKDERLSALKRQSIHNYFNILVFAILLLIFLMFVGFASLIYFKNTDKHEMKKTWELANTAYRAVDDGEDSIRKLTSTLALKKCEISTLQNDVNKYSADIDELHKNKAENHEKTKD